VDRRLFCTECLGDGSLGCLDCSGYGHKLVQQCIEVQVPKGCVGGMEIEYKCKGHQCRARQVPGSLICVIEELPDAIFTRKGPDLHVNIGLGSHHLSDGFVVLIEHLDDKRYPVQVARGQASTTEPLLVSQLGFQMYGNQHYGDLHLHFQLVQNSPAPPGQTDQLTNSPIRLDIGSKYSSKGPSCHISGGFRPIGSRQQWDYSYGAAYKWSCCGSQAQNPSHHSRRERRTKSGNRDPSRKDSR